MGLHLVLAVQTDLAGSPSHLEQSLADAIASLRPTGLTIASLGRQGSGASVRVALGPFRATKLRHLCLVLGVTFWHCPAQSPNSAKGVRSRAFVSPRRRNVRIVIVRATGSSARPPQLELSAQGHQVIAVARRKQPLGLIPATIVNLDVAEATDPADFVGMRTMFAPRRWLGLS